MKRINRLFSVVGGVVLLSLLVVANVWAFGVGNVDGVWQVAEDGGGASCDGWASAGIQAFSDTYPTIQSSGGNLTDENRTAYGRPYGQSRCPDSWTNFKLQSGFGFNGINGPVSGLNVDVPFYLGSFTHYNNPIYSASNSLDWVDLSLTVPIDCDGNGSTDTSFSFEPRFYLDETPNGDSSCPYKPGDPVNSNGCADAVTIVQPATTTFVCESVQYTVNIYGFTSNANCSTVFDQNAVATQYITKEQATNNACLWAEIDAPVADASVSKSCLGFDGADPYYTVTVTNAGPGTSLGAKIVDTLPGGVSFKSYTSTRTVGGTATEMGSCSISGQTLSCQLNAALPETTTDPTAKWEVRVNVNYAAGADWTNNVVLTTTSTDPNTANNTASATCQGVADLSVTKSDGDYNADPYPYVGDAFKYTVTVTNKAGSAYAKGVVMVDTLDAYLEYLSDDGNAAWPITINGVNAGSVCSWVDNGIDPVGAGGTLTCQLGDIPGGQSKVVEFWTRVQPGGPTAGIIEIGDSCTTADSSDVCNVVNVTTQSLETATENNSASEPKDVGAPTAVVLSDFKAIGKPLKIKLEWTTESEFEVAGFNLYRAKSAEGDRVLITPTMIPIQGTDTTGFTYIYKDKGLKANKVYYYWLETIDTNGNSELFGPVSAKVKPQ